jgi:hypothetical protein
MVLRLFTAGKKPGFLGADNDRRAQVSRQQTEYKLSELINIMQDKLRDPEKALDMYKFYQGRVEALRLRLWTMLSWLAAAQAAILVLVVKEFHMRVGASPNVLFTIDQPLIVLVLAIFGIALSTYMMNIIDDGSGHIEVNWRRADIALGKVEPHQIEQDIKLRRGRHPVCRVMAEVAGWTRIAQCLLVALAVLVIVDSWGLYDIPFVGAPDKDAVSKGESVQPAPEASAPLFRR